MIPDYSTPPGFKPGLLPRKTAFGKLRGVPPLRDTIEVIPEKDLPDFIQRQDGLRPYIPPCYGMENEDGIYDQEQVGSCAAEACNQGASVLRVAKGLRWVEFNPWGMYHTTSGGSDNGSTLDDNLAFAMEHGCFPEDVWPRSNGWQVRPSNAAYEKAHDFRVLEAFDIGGIDEMLTALVKGYPVYYGSDGHAKLYVKALDLYRGLYANSWSTGWGDQGFGKEDFKNVWLAYGAFALRSVSDSDTVPEPQAGKPV